MKFDDSFYKMIKDLERQIAPFRDLERISGFAFRDITQSVADRENFLRGLVPDLSSRYQSIAELVQRDLNRYMGLSETSKHMAGIANATSIVAEFFKDQKSLTQMAAEAIGASKHWQTQVDMFKGFTSETEACRLVLKTHYADIAELSLIAQDHMRQLRWDKIGYAIHIDPDLVSPAASSFSKMVESYEQLFRSFQKAEYNMASFPPFISKLPPVEIITGSDFLRTISGEEWEEPHEEIEEIQYQLGEDIEASLEDLLVRLDPGLIPLWQGARKSLKSDNPDRSRHTIISLREMVTHILHKTAPDSDIRSWTTDQSFYRDGRPTRQARLLFICRGVNHDPFHHFVKKDVSAHIELIRILQRGTHELSIDLTDEQLKALVMRTESLLRFILVIWNSNN